MRIVYPVQQLGPNVPNVVGRSAHWPEVQHAVGGAGRINPRRLSHTLTDHSAAVYSGPGRSIQMARGIQRMLSSAFFVYRYARRQISPDVVFNGSDGIQRYPNGGRLVQNPNGELIRPPQYATNANTPTGQLYRLN